MAGAVLLSAAGVALVVRGMIGSFSIGLPLLLAAAFTLRAAVAALTVSFVGLGVSG